jgi:DNA-binding MarR family transcriptional regulator
VNKTTNAAFNGLNYVSAFKAAWAEQNLKERVSIEHMETFFFIVTAREQDGIELRRLQKALNYAQAKMHRTAATLESLGWIEIKDSTADARQKSVSLTASGEEFFIKLGHFLSTEDRSSTFKKRSRDMMDEIREDAKTREAVRALDWQQRSDRSDLQWLAGVERSEPKHVEFSVKKGNLKIEGKDAELRSERAERIIRNRSIAKRQREENERARMEMRDVLRQRGEREIEIGEKYIKTKRNIVTFPVLLKRTGARSLGELVSVFKNCSDDELNRFLTPTPKTKLERLKAELDTILNYGWGAVEANPHLFQKVHVLRAEIAALEAKMGRGLGSLQDNPVTKDAWEAAIDEQRLWQEITHDDAIMDAAEDAKRDEQDERDDT